MYLSLKVYDGGTGALTTAIRTVGVVCYSPTDQEAKQIVL